MKRPNQDRSQRTIFKEEDRGHKPQAAAVGQLRGSPAVPHQYNSGSTGELREKRILPLHPSNMEHSKIDAALLKQVSIQL